MLVPIKSSFNRLIYFHCKPIPLSKRLLDINNQNYVSKSIYLIFAYANHSQRDQRIYVTRKFPNADIITLQRSILNIITKHTNKSFIIVDCSELRNAQAIFDPNNTAAAPLLHLFSRVGPRNPGDLDAA